jgi:hypothetical protein
MLARVKYADLTDAVDIIDERLVALREVGHFGGPVVHLDVDVRMVVAGLGGLIAVVPDPLQIRGISFLRSPMRWIAKNAAGKHHALEANWDSS